MNFFKIIVIFQLFCIISTFSCPFNKKRTRVEKVDSDGEISKRDYLDCSKYGEILDSEFDDDPHKANMLKKMNEYQEFLNEKAVKLGIDLEDVV